VTAYIARRLLLLIPVLFGISVIVFLVISLIPGDPATAILGAFATPDNVARINRELGLDRPLPVQYLTWLAGVLEGDAPDEVADKIHRSVEDVLPAADSEWVEEQLLALVGQGVEAQLGGDRRGQAFAAWRRFLEGLAEQRPLVLVVEDLHWADDSMLDFVDELVDWVSGVPLLVVGTARPELLTRRPDWAGGKLNATTVALSPLTDEQTAALIGALLARPVLADEQRMLLENAGGNPLYAEQFAELYLERGSAEDLPLPETLQGLIAARLDGLAGEEKGLLQDAAVVGKVFWRGALERLRPDREDLPGLLGSLERRDMIRRDASSRIRGDQQFTFKHGLIREVAYLTLPRAERRRCHETTARYLEDMNLRSGDGDATLAYHWREAGDAEKALRYLLAAAEASGRGWAKARAARLYAQALELIPEEHADMRREVTRKRAVAAASMLHAIEMEATRARPRDPEAAG